ncbi:MAG: hypothetical protein A2W90_05040 [Bacteroidetes bacterium GWF2_42_66]|nr:MAG: hypothetical protein A2W92_03215 [Bacteroidetes bacterium GWA2_42_15]OFX95950.1 MAG: hypothetical protein A2W89_02450 [Bacteroidetes bacterium GWE2_42_39]OFY46523.1 MAG: hypothetical protein A2W90_05040 [Bacteroidetes bacterium GWF2_42_66]HBL75625.1 hypothetical protein [Prolixibacteraceae bacterium]HCU62652.1 hypothetical protein [Prolixibacteraceae bacterium]
MHTEPINNPENTPQAPKPPTIIDGMMQPGFPTAKVFTCFFLSDCLVFVKTGSFSTNMAGTMRASLGGYTGDAMIMGAIGGIADYHNQQKRMKNAVHVAGWNPEQMVAVHKRNFMLPYSAINTIELKGPNFAGEVRVIVEAGETHKFRLNRQSKASFAYCEKIFSEFLPGKVVHK